jgi:hypothetical protein
MSALGAMAASTSSRLDLPHSGTGKWMSSSGEIFEGVMGVGEQDPQRASKRPLARQSDVPPDLDKVMCRLMLP